MSCIPKFDEYFDKLKKFGDTVVVPAESMVKLTGNVWYYQRSEKRNKKGLYLKCENILNRSTGKNEFTVRVVGTGRWSK